MQKLVEAAADPIPFAPNSAAPLQWHRGERRKRALDFVGAVLLIVLCAPVFLIVAFAVACDGGPVLFRHQRIGRGGVPFHCLKFRSMVLDSERVLREFLAGNPEARQEWGQDFKLRDDPRITTVGRFLRKTSLDELPQLFNVVRGDMSLVGPRPIVAAEIARYGHDIAHYYRCRPGITGLWQVSGRNDMGYTQRVLLDVEYAGRCSLRRDIAILARTARVVLLGVGAY